MCARLLDSCIEATARKTIKLSEGRGTTIRGNTKQEGMELTFNSCQEIFTCRVMMEQLHAKSKEKLVQIG